MDPRIAQALADKVPPQVIIGWLQAEGSPIPPELQAMVAQPQAAPQAEQPDALRNAVGAGVSMAADAAADHPYVAGVLGAGAAFTAGEKATRSTRANRRLAQLGGRDALEQALQRYEATGRGQLVTLADLSDAARRQADFTATHNPPAGDEIARIHQERQAGVPSRVRQDVVALSPTGVGGQAPAARSEIAQTGEAKAAFAQSEQGFEGLRRANPIVQDPQAFEAFLNAEGNEAVRAAYGKVRAKMVLAGNSGVPSFSTLHQMDRDLNKQITAAFQAGDGDLGRELKAARIRLLDHIEAQVGPQHKTAASQYRAFSRHQELLDEGLKFWNEAMQVEDVQRMVQSMRPEELNVFRRGVASGLLTKLDQAQKGGSNVANQLLRDGELTTAKLEVIFGSKSTLDRFLSRLAQERQLSLAGGIGKGSQTAARLSEEAAEAGIAEADDVMRVASNPQGSAIRAVLDRLLPSTRRLARGTAKELAPWFTAQGSEALRELLKKLPK
jgi:hypothetical protein